MMVSRKLTSRLIAPPSGARGMTLIEVMIATTILSVMILMAFETTNVAAKAFAVATIQSDIRYSARKAVDEISDALIGINPETVIESESAFSPPSNSGSITFRKALWYDPEADEFIYSNLFHIIVINGELRLYEDYIDGSSGEPYKILAEGVADSLEGEIASNGVDDNGNGLEDEGGLCLAADGANVLISLTLERFDVKTDQTFQATVYSIIKLRNNVASD